MLWVLHVAPAKDLGKLLHHIVTRSRASTAGQKASSAERGTRMAGRAVQGQAGKGRAGQGRAGQGSAGQGRAYQQSHCACMQPTLGVGP